MYVCVASTTNCNFWYAMDIYIYRCVYRCIHVALHVCTYMCAYLYLGQESCCAYHLLQLLVRYVYICI